MMWNLESPNQELKVCVIQKENGKVYYSVSKHGQYLIEESCLGLETNKGRFGENPVFQEEKTSSVREEYSIPVGKKEIYENHAKELALIFQEHGAEFTVRFRAFDDGMAFRYEVVMPEEKEVLVERENTEFRLGIQFGNMWLQDWVPTYEGPYQERNWDKSINGQPFGMPSLFFDDQEEIWIMLNEANVLNTNGSFCSCHLVGDENRCMTISFAPEEKGRAIRTTLPFYSSWRYAVVADDLNELVNSTVNYNLNPPAEFEDTSWIRPGRSLWAWWEDMNGAQLYLESRNYVDMAAACGFEGVTLDCGWDACWVKDLCEYAHKKGVQIWIWTAMQRLDTREKAEELIPLWASWGVDGLKIDFFENDSQHTMWQYNMLADLMKEYKLMINFHGSVKPMGEGRTWPHFMTAEGIMGLEHYQWSNLPDAVHNCTVPFTRNVAGPMDYTPTGFSNLKNRNTTMGHQMALPVVFDSGITNYALALRYIEGWKGTDFLRRTKNHYKDVKVLSGYPGDHAAILRYTDTEWLIGVITSPKKVVNISLDFLGEGVYEAEIYEDAAKGEMISTTRRTVTAEDTLRLSLLAAGGAGVYITRKIEPLQWKTSPGYMSGNYKEYFGKDARMSRGSEIVEWDSEVSGFVLNGEATFSCAAEKSGNYTLRIFYAAEEPWKAEISCGDFKMQKQMMSSTAIRTFITQDVVIPVQSGEFQLNLKRIDGKAPGVWKIKLIDNDPFMPLSYPVKEEYLQNGGEIVMENGAVTAVGVGNTVELEFNEVCVSAAGVYVVRIIYAGGDSRDISIQANEETPIHTYLHSSSGWDFPTWENVCEKEVLVNLKEGRNKIRLYNDHGLLSHIKGIEVIAK